MEQRTIKNGYHTLDELYISPFSSIRKFDEIGQPYYVPLKQHQNPTGIYAADTLLQSLTKGQTKLMQIAKGLGCSGRDLSGLIRCLTGLPSDDFRRLYRLRLIDDLLRFTSLSLADVAEHSGIGTERNLHFFIRRNHACTPQERRDRIRKPGDEGRFSISEK